jgi:hypothetical protein
VREFSNWLGKILFVAWNAKHILCQGCAQSQDSI